MAELGPKLLCGVAVKREKRCTNYHLLLLLHITMEPGQENKAKYTQSRGEMKSAYVLKLFVFLFFHRFYQITDQFITQALLL